MRLPKSYIQLNAAQSDKFSELLSFVREQGIEVPENSDWFYVTFEYIARTMLYQRYGHLDMFWFKCIERQTQHPIDFLYEFKKDCEKRKVPVLLRKPKTSELNAVLYDDSTGQAILEMFDYCQEISPIYSTKDVITFDEKGTIEGTPFSWYQLTLNYIVPVLLYEKTYRCQPHNELDPNKDFDWIGRMVYSLRTKDPIPFIKSIYKKRADNIPLHEETVAYVKAISKQEKEQKKRA